MTLPAGITQQENQNPDQTQNQNQQPSDPAVTDTPQSRVYTEQEVQALHNLYGQTLREAEQARVQLQTQLNERPQPVQQDQQQPTDFFTNPSNVIGAEIEKRLEPFSQFIRQQQAQTQYSQLKQTFKTHPSFSAFFNIPQAEAILDQQVANMPPQNVNVNGIAGLINQIYGYMMMNGMVQPQQPNSFNQPTIQQPIQPQQPMNNNQQPSNLITPPHLRPSAPPMPTNGGQNLTPKGNLRRPLTELERRVARENGLTEDGYIDWLNEDTTRVYISDIGKQQPAGGQ